MTAARAAVCFRAKNGGGMRTHAAPRCFERCPAYAILVSSKKWPAYRCGGRLQFRGGGCIVCFRSEKTAVFAVMSGKIIGRSFMKKRISCLWGVPLAALAFALLLCGCGHHHHHHHSEPPHHGAPAPKPGKPGKPGKPAPKPSKPGKPAPKPSKPGKPGKSAPKH